LYSLTGTQDLAVCLTYHYEIFIMKTKHRVMNINKLGLLHLTSIFFLKWLTACWWHYNFLPL